MVGVECLKKVSPICISKKLGLYIKNGETDYEKDIINDLLIKDYELKKEKTLNENIYAIFRDSYYNGLFECNILKLKSNQLLSLIAENILIFDIVSSKETIITDDEIFYRCESDSELSKELAITPLINPIDECEIEHKFLYLFNFIESSHSEKMDDLYEIFYTGYPEEKIDILSNFCMKTYKQRDDWCFFGYEYYKNYREEFNCKINRLLRFGQKYDYVISNSNEYLKVDFIIETLISAENSQYALLNYISLIEMLIVNSKNSSRSEFKNKLKKYIIDKNINESDKEYLSVLFYDIRSRMIHGDFSKLKRELQKYKKKFMKEFMFDYGEFKEENWIIGNINAHLKQIVSNIMFDYFYNKEKLDNLKFSEKIRNK